MAVHTMQELKQFQAMPLEVKVMMSKVRIRDWVNYYGRDGVYVSFSGGKDSTVLLHMVREEYPDIPAIFVDTGLEYPEIREFVKTFDNVTWLKPKMNFRQVIEKYGYPFFSKETSEAVWYSRKYIREIVQTDRQTDRQIIGSAFIADLMGIERRGEAKYSKNYLDLKKGIIPKYDGKHGMPIRILQLMGKFPHTEKGKMTDEYSKRYDKSKYQFMLDAPFEISNRCCAVMKKEPANRYAKETGKHPMTAQMAAESALRTSKWIKYGCNAFEAKKPMSNPMSFWTEQDVLRYIKENNIPICSVYGDIIPDSGEEMEGQMDISDLGLAKDVRPLKTTGCNRTGCMFCGFGCHLEKEGEGRFERMKITHPKVYDYLMRSKEKGGLNYKEVIDWINEHGNLNIKY